MNDSAKEVITHALHEVRGYLERAKERLASMERDVEATRARIANHIKTIADFEEVLA